MARLRNEPGTTDLTPLQPIVDAAAARRSEFAALSDDELRDAARALHTDAPLDDTDLAEYCAIAREVGRRVVRIGDRAPLELGDAHGIGGL